MFNTLGTSKEEEKNKMAEDKIVQPDSPIKEVDLEHLGPKVMDLKTVIQGDKIRSNKSKKEG